MQQRLHHPGGAVEHGAHQGRGRHDPRHPLLEARVKMRLLAHFARAAPQLPHHDPAGQRGGPGGGGKADVGHQADCHHRIGDHRGDGVAERTAAVFPCVKQRLQHLVQHERGQTDAVDGQDNGGGIGIGCGEGAAFVQHRAQGFGNHHQRHGGGQCHRERKLCPAVERGATAHAILGAQTSGQVRQQDGADGNAHHPEGQLVQPIGIGQPSHGPVGIGCDLPPHQQVDLHHPTRQNRRPGDQGQPLQIGRPARPAITEGIAHTAR